MHDFAPYRMKFIRDLKKWNTIQDNSLRTWETVAKDGKMASLHSTWAPRRGWGQSKLPKGEQARKVFLTQGEEDDEGGGEVNIRGKRQQPAHLGLTFNLSFVLENLGKTKTFLQ